MVIEGRCADRVSFGLEIFMLRFGSDVVLLRAFLDSLDQNKAKVWSVRRPAAALLQPANQPDTSLPPPSSLLQPSANRQPSKGHGAHNDVGDKRHECLRQ